MFKLRSHVHNRQTRSSSALDIPLCRLSTGQRSFAYRGAKLWNSLNSNIKSLKCPKSKQCELHEHLDKNSEEYQRWKADHTTWKANIKGSAPAMEPEGVHRIFKCSVELHNLRYAEYYGDGDSKSFSKVKDVYQTSEITKEGMYWPCAEKSRHSSS